MYTFFVSLFCFTSRWLDVSNDRENAPRERARASERASVDVDVDDGRVTALGFTDVPREGGVGGDDG